MGLGLEVRLCQGLGVSLTIFLDLVFGIRLCLGLGIGPGKRLGVGETLFGGDLGDKKNSMDRVCDLV